jgi:hypothetical protein
MEENKYSRGKIYKIVDNTNGNIYVGSTTEPTLARRLAKHRAGYKRYLEGKNNYLTSFEILKNNNYIVVLVENCPCKTKDELYKKERHYIEILDCVNKVIVGRTQQEYYIDNRETKLEYHKNYALKNRTKLIEKSKNYYNDNKEELLLKNKTYRDNRKDEVSEYHKQYRTKNKDKVNQRQSEKFECACGGNYTYAHKAEHCKSKMHQEYLKKEQQNNLNKEN